MFKFIAKVLKRFGGRRRMRRPLTRVSTGWQTCSQSRSSPSPLAGGCLRRVGHAHTPSLAYGSFTVYECERCRSTPRQTRSGTGWLMRRSHLNIFHVAVPYPEPSAGAVYTHHAPYLGLYRQTRIARIRAYRKYFVAWGEFRSTALTDFRTANHSRSYPLTRRLSHRQSCARTVPYSWGTVFVSIV